MARIILFWCFENINIYGRIMKFQVQFWHSSDLRLWRTGYVIYVKIDWWNSNAHCSKTCLQRKINKIIDPSIPQSHLQSHISMWDTLYLVFECSKKSCKKSSRRPPKDRDFENTKITKKTIPELVDQRDKRKQVCNRERPL